MFKNLNIPQRSISQGRGIKMGYKEEIINLLNNIKDDRILKYIYDFVNSFLKKYTTSF